MIPAAVLREYGAPPDVVLDMFCGTPAEAALEASAINGRLVQLGRSAAETMEFKSATVRGRALSILGHTNVFTPPEVRRASHDWLFRKATAGARGAHLQRRVAPESRQWEKNAHEAALALGPRGSEYRAQIGSAEPPDQ
jgi:NADPH:quinone reductase-like Zn-dependent oxidoreductase